MKKIGRAPTAGGGMTGTAVAVVAQVNARHCSATKCSTTRCSVGGSSVTACSAAACSVTCSSATVCSSWANRKGGQCPPFPTRGCYNLGDTGKRWTNLARTFLVFVTSLGFQNLPHERQSLCAQLGVGVIRFRVKARHVVCRVAFRGGSH